MFTITKINIMVDIKTNAKIKSFPGKSSLIVAGELVSQPKTKFVPSVEALRISLIILERNAKSFTPKGTFIIKTAKANCKNNPTPIVLRFIFFLLLDIKKQIPRIAIIPTTPTNLDKNPAKFSKTIFLYISTIYYSEVASEFFGLSC